MPADLSSSKAGNDVACTSISTTPSKPTDLKEGTGSQSGNSDNTLPSCFSQPSLVLTIKAEEWDKFPTTSSGTLSTDSGDADSKNNELMTGEGSKRYFRYCNPIVSVTTTVDRVLISSTPTWVRAINLNNDIHNSKLLVMYVTVAWTHANLAKQTVHTLGPTEFKAFLPRWSLVKKNEERVLSETEGGMCLLAKMLTGDKELRAPKGCGKQLTARKRFDKAFPDEVKLDEGAKTALFNTVAQELARNRNIEGLNKEEQCDMPEDLDRYFENANPE